jgi:hypothetical protein
MVSHIDLNAANEHNVTVAEVSGQGESSLKIKLSARSPTQTQAPWQSM